MRAAVVVPTYNERENLRPLFEAIRSTGLDVRVIIVDDNSPDGTGTLADELAAAHAGLFVVHREGREGYGRALTAGLRFALDNVPDADAIVSMDADFSHQPRYLPRLLQALDDHDVAIGSRYAPGGGVSNWGLHRRLLSRGGNLYTRLMTGLRIRDCTAGFIAFRRHVLQSLPLESLGAQGYSFLIELKYLIASAGFTIAEIPIVFVERERGKSKMNLGIATEALMLAWRLRWRRGSQTRIRPGAPGHP